MKEKRFTLRMDLALYKAIAASAGKNRRSVSGEIQWAIDCYLKQMDAPDERAADKQ